MSAPAEPWRVLRWRSSNQAFVERADGLELVLMRIPAGAFLMGAPEREEGSGEEERPVHRVSLGDFLMGQIPVTRKQWNVVAGWRRQECELSPIEETQDCDDLPWAQVSWAGAVEFCRRLADRTGKFYELPTEAEWEYACRAGSIHAYSWGPVFHPELAQKGANLSNSEAPGLYANTMGLQAMHGVGSEWCIDHWHENYTGAPADELAWLGVDQSMQQGADLRVIRGGSQEDGPKRIRSAARAGFPSDGSSVIAGFRLCCLSPLTRKERLFCSASLHGMPRSQKRDKDSVTKIREDGKWDVDVYISYAHIDNESLHDGQKGWVDMFRETLRRRIAQYLGKQPKIWFDKEQLRGDDYIGSESYLNSIVMQFPKVNLFIFVLSPSYLNSEWCKRELHEFSESCKERGGVLDGSKSRIFKVIKVPVGDVKLPEEALNVTGYEFFELEGGRARALDPAFGEKINQKFLIKIDDLAQDIADLLKKSYSNLSAT